ncbi:SDR family NAD(P)-dependent oxidoreductase [Sphingobacterium sp.]|uniref:SDR family NAD(P)-dependent oxidoreductase n=1 Tax=Sphingobacterium sp. TaxID=341027 RepID=UPI0028A04160|nr:SDR family NAD(P)-dependent oxidoreductase [Sphingobacterium sp.]
MARIFITGSSDGLGLLAAKELIAGGHQVVLHARNEERKEATLAKIERAEDILIGDLSSIEETKALAGEVNKWGTFDAVIHNAGVYTAPSKDILMINVLAPYILTSLIQKPRRLIYLSSDMHLQGQPKLEYLGKDVERINYSDSKLHVLMLCKAVARKWKDVYANAVNPGWVPTKMGGSHAPDSLEKGYATQVWLATSNDEQARVSGRFFFHQKARQSHPEADNSLLQDRLLAICEAITGIVFPGYK